MKTTSVSAVHVKLKSSLWFEMYNFPESAWNPNYASTNTYDKWLDEQWETYQNRYIKKNEVIKEKSNFQLLKEEKTSIENEVFDILDWKKKIVKTDSKKSNTSNPSNQENELDEEILEEKEEEYNENIDLLKISKNWSPEQKKLVKDILDDWFWKFTKKNKDSKTYKHPFYWEMKISLINWKIDDNNCTIMLPAWNWSIIIKDWKITYKK
jgi:hypothetical protein